MLCIKSIDMLMIIPTLNFTTLIVMVHLLFPLNENLNNKYLTWLPSCYFTVYKQTYLDPTLSSTSITSTLMIGTKVISSGKA